MHRITGALLILASCGGVALQDFPEEAATAYCERAESCGELAANDVPDCIDTSAGLLQLAVDFQDSSEYDEAQAGRCVRALGGLDCDDLDLDSVPECDAIFGEAE
jgi:hypothetical protein